jgi:hypothetical protein
VTNEINGGRFRLAACCVRKKSDGRCYPFDAHPSSATPCQATFRAGTPPQMLAQSAPLPEGGRDYTLTQFHAADQSISPVDFEYSCCDRALLQNTQEIA